MAAGCGPRLWIVNHRRKIAVPSTVVRTPTSLARFRGVSSSIVSKPSPIGRVCMVENSQL